MNLAALRQLDDLQFAAEVARSALAAEIAQVEEAERPVLPALDGKARFL